jgi:hypothetical protein
LVAQETVVDDSIVVSVESTPADTMIAIRYKSENGYVLLRTYQLTENEKKEATASPKALRRIVNKKGIPTREDIKKAVLGAAGISSN